MCSKYVCCSLVQGIVSNSTPLLQDPLLVKKVKEKNLVLFTWGHENKVLQNIAAQESSGVDAVIWIYDR